MSSQFDPSQIRVGDPERTEALDRLGEHFANGYLTVDEFEERTGKAATARTREDLSVLFGDLPGMPAANAHTAPVPAKRNADEPAALTDSEAEKELDEMLARKRKLDISLTVLWAVCMAVFFIGLFALEWDYFWVVFPVGGILSAALYYVFGISDDDEKVLEKIEKDRSKERAERLRIAHERRKQLGK